MRQIDNVQLKTPSGKPLRASPAMDVWALGLVMYELFTNEPYFAGCSDDVALQVLASAAPLEIPMARVSDLQAQHLIAKLLVKPPKERAGVEAILKHAYLVGGLDTQQVGGSFAMLHTSQQTFKDELGRLQSGMGEGERPGGAAAAPADEHARGHHRRGGGAATREKRAQFEAEIRKEAAAAGRRV